MMGYGVIIVVRTIIGMAVAAAVPQEPTHHLLAAVAVAVVPLPRSAPVVPVVLITIVLEAPLRHNAKRARSDKVVPVAVTRPVPVAAVAAAAGMAAVAAACNTMARHRCTHMAAAVEAAGSTHRKTMTCGHKEILRMPTNTMWTPGIY